MVSITTTTTISVFITITTTTAAAAILVIVSVSTVPLSGTTQPRGTLSGYVNWTLSYYDVKSFGQNDTLAEVSR